MSIFFSVAEPAERGDFHRTYREAGELTRLLFAPFGLQYRLLGLFDSVSSVDKEYAQTLQQLEDLVAKKVFARNNFGDDQIMASMSAYMGMDKDIELTETAQKGLQAVSNLLEPPRVTLLFDSPSTVSTTTAPSALSPPASSSTQGSGNTINNEGGVPVDLRKQLMRSLHKQRTNNLPKLPKLPKQENFEKRDGLPTDWSDSDRALAQHILHGDLSAALATPEITAILLTKVVHALQRALYHVHSPSSLEPTQSAATKASDFQQLHYSTGDMIDRRSGKSSNNADYVPSSAALPSALPTPPHSLSPSLVLLHETDEEVWRELGIRIPTRLMQPLHSLARDSWRSRSFLSAASGSARGAAKGSTTGRGTASGTSSSESEAVHCDVLQELAQCLTLSSSEISAVVTTPTKLAVDANNTGKDDCASLPLSAAAADSATELRRTGENAEGVDALFVRVSIEEFHSMLDAYSNSDAVKMTLQTLQRSWVREALGLLPAEKTTGFDVFVDSEDDSSESAAAEALREGSVLYGLNISTHPLAAFLSQATRIVRALDPKSSPSRSAGGNTEEAGFVEKDAEKEGEGEGDRGGHEVWASRRREKVERALEVVHSALAAIDQSERSMQNYENKQSEEDIAEENEEEKLEEAEEESEEKKDEGDKEKDRDEKERKNPENDAETSPSAERDRQVERQTEEALEKGGAQKDAGRNCVVKEDLRKLASTNGSASPRAEDSLPMNIRSSLAYSSSSSSSSVRSSVKIKKLLDAVDALSAVVCRFCPSAEPPNESSNATSTPTTFTPTLNAAVAAAAAQKKQEENEVGKTDGAAKKKKNGREELYSEAVVLPVFLKKNVYLARAKLCRFIGQALLATDPVTSLSAQLEDLQIDVKQSETALHRMQQQKQQQQQQEQLYPNPVFSLSDQEHNVTSPTFEEAQQLEIIALQSRRLEEKRADCIKSFFSIQISLLCALNDVNSALQLDPKSPECYTMRTDGYNSLIACATAMPSPRNASAVSEIPSSPPPPNPASISRETANLGGFWDIQQVKQWQHLAARDALAAFKLGGSIDLALAEAAGETAREACRDAARELFYSRNNRQRRQQTVSTAPVHSENIQSQTETEAATQVETAGKQGQSTRESRDAGTLPGGWFLRAYFSSYDFLGDGFQLSGTSYPDLLNWLNLSSQGTGGGRLEEEEERGIRDGDGEDGWPCGMNDIDEGSVEGEGEKEGEKEGESADDLFNIDPLERKSLVEILTSDDLIGTFLSSLSADFRAYALLVEATELMNIVTYNLRHESYQYISSTHSAAPPSPSAPSTAPAATAVVDTFDAVRSHVPEPSRTTTTAEGESIPIVQDSALLQSTLQAIRLQMQGTVDGAAAAAAAGGGVVDGAEALYHLIEEGECPVTSPASATVTAHVASPSLAHTEETGSEESTEQHTEQSCKSKTKQKKIERDIEGEEEEKIVERRNAAAAAEIRRREREWTERSTTRKLLDVLNCAPAQRLTGVRFAADGAFHSFLDKCCAPKLQHSIYSISSSCDSPAADANTDKDGSCNGNADQDTGAICQCTSRDTCACGLCAGVPRECGDGNAVDVSSGSAGACERGGGGDVSKGLRARLLVLCGNVAYLFGRDALGARACFLRAVSVQFGVKIHEIHSNTFAVGHSPSPNDGINANFKIDFLREEKPFDALDFKELGKVCALNYESVNAVIQLAALYTEMDEQDRAELWLKRAELLVVSAGPEASIALRKARKRQIQLQQKSQLKSQNLLAITRRPTAVGRGAAGEVGEVDADADIDVDLVADADLAAAMDETRETREEKAVQKIELDRDDHVAEQVGKDQVEEEEEEEEEERLLHRINQTRLLSVILLHSAELEIHRNAFSAAQRLLSRGLHQLQVFSRMRCDHLTYFSYPCCPSSSSSSACCSHGSSCSPVERGGELSAVNRMQKEKERMFFALFPSFSSVVEALRHRLDPLFGLSRCPEINNNICYSNSNNDKRGDGKTTTITQNSSTRRGRTAQARTQRKAPENSAQMYKYRRIAEARRALWEDDLMANFRSLIAVSALRAQPNSPEYAVESVLEGIEAQNSTKEPRNCNNNCNNCNNYNTTTAAARSAESSYGYPFWEDSCCGVPKDEISEEECTVFGGLSLRVCSPILLMCGAEIFGQVGDFATALQFLRVADAKEGGGNPLAYSNAGRLYLPLGQRGLAQRHFQRAIDLDPTQPMTMVDMAQLLLQYGATTEEALPSNSLSNPSSRSLSNPTSEPYRTCAAAAGGVCKESCQQGAHSTLGLSKKSDTDQLHQQEQEQESGRVRPGEGTAAGVGRVELALNMLERALRHSRQVSEIRDVLTSQAIALLQRDLQAEGVWQE